MGLKKKDVILIDGVTTSKTYVLVHRSRTEEAGIRPILMVQGDASKGGVAILMKLRIKSLGGKADGEALSKKYGKKHPVDRVRNTSVSTYLKVEFSWESEHDLKKKWAQTKLYLEDQLLWFMSQFRTKTCDHDEMTLFLIAEYKKGIEEKIDTKLTRLPKVEWNDNVATIKFKETGG